MTAQKLLKKKTDKEAPAAIAQSIYTIRESISRECSTSVRAKSLKEQVKSLQKLLSQEKRHGANSSLMMDRYLPEEDWCVGAGASINDWSKHC